MVDGTWSKGLADLSYQSNAWTINYGMIVFEWLIIVNGHVISFPVIRFKFFKW